MTFCKGLRAITFAALSGHKAQTVLEARGVRSRGRSGAGRVGGGSRTEPSRRRRSPHRTGRPPPTGRLQSRLSRAQNVGAYTLAVCHVATGELHIAATSPTRLRHGPSIGGNSPASEPFGDGARCGRSAQGQYGMGISAEDMGAYFEEATGKASTDWDELDGILKMRGHGQEYIKRKATWPRTGCERARHGRRTLAMSHALRQTCPQNPSFCNMAPTWSRREESAPPMPCGATACHGLRRPPGGKIMPGGCP